MSDVIADDTLAGDDTLPAAPDLLAEMDAAGKPMAIKADLKRKFAALPAMFLPFKAKVLALDAKLKSHETGFTPEQFEALKARRRGACYELSHTLRQLADTIDAAVAPPPEAEADDNFSGAEND